VIPSLLEKSAAPLELHQPKGDAQSPENQHNNQIYKVINFSKDNPRRPKTIIFKKRGNSKLSNAQKMR